MQVRIVSLFALTDPGEGPRVWEGEVKNVTTLDDIYRYFNRVDELDGERLERIGYNMPSLSVGDLVGIEKGPIGDTHYELWRVAGVGFDRVYPGLP